MRYVNSVFLVLLFFYSANSARILGIFPMASISHQVVFQPIWRELSLRGHQVTVMTPNPLKDPTLTNLTEIDMGHMYDSFRQMSGMFASALSHWDMLKMLTFFKQLSIDPFFSNPEVLSLINDTSKEFDVVIAEYLWTFPAAFSHKFKCPLIGVASLGVWSSVHEAMGNPVHTTLYPELITTYGDELSFYERVDSFVYSTYYSYIYRSSLRPMLDEELRKYFGNDLPSLAELENNVSMLFLNTNPVIHKPRPYVPGTIEMGRMHIKPKKALPGVSIQLSVNEYECAARHGMII